MEKANQRIKLPSKWTIVNPESIWHFITIISQTGQVFDKDQLIKSGLNTNSDDAIGRNLAYLKYLQLIEEERGNGVDQRFKVIEQKSVKEIIYELKANRNEDAKRKFKEHMEGHILFSTLKDNFFKDDKHKTLHELEHFLKDSIPNKAPEYYQKGGEFIINLLNIASLASLSGNNIKLEVEGAMSSNTLNAAVTPEITHRENKDVLLPPAKTDYDEVQIITPDKYVVQFIGPGMNTRLEIQEEDDLIIVEATLAKIRKKLKANEAN